MVFVYVIIPARFYQIRLVVIKLVEIRPPEGRLKLRSPGCLRWPNFHGQKNLLNLEINYGSEKAKREPTQV